MDLPQLTKYLQTQLVIQPRHFMVEYASSAKMKQQYVSKPPRSARTGQALEQREEGVSPKTGDKTTI